MESSSRVKKCVCKFPVMASGLNIARCLGKNLQREQKCVPTCLFLLTAAYYIDGLKMGKLLMKAIALIFLPILATGSLVICEQEAVAANKQGGGTFFAPKNKTLKRSKKATVTKTAPTAANVNYDGQYSMRMNIISNISHQSCFSGQRKITISNDRTSGEIVPFVGALLGGTVRNGTLQLFKIKGGLLDNANYNGSITVPARVGSIGKGQVRSDWTKKGGGQCVWQASLKRL